MRGIRCATQGAADAIATRLTTAAGYPRCERLSGALEINGRSVGANDPRLDCRCTRADTPHATCPFATRAEVRSTRLAVNWSCPVTEGKPAVLAALTAPERALIETIPDSEMRPR